MASSTFICRALQSGKLLCLEASAPAVMVTPSVAEQLNHEWTLERDRAFQRLQAAAWRRCSDGLEPLTADLLPLRRNIAGPTSPGPELVPVRVPLPKTATGAIGDAELDTTVLVDVDHLVRRAVVVGTPSQIRLNDGRAADATTIAARLLDPALLPAGLAFAVTPSGAAWAADRVGRRYLSPLFAGPPSTLGEECVAQAKAGRRWPLLTPRIGRDELGNQLWSVVELAR
jgi:hypothetical protein